MDSRQDTIICILVPSGKSDSSCTMKALLFCPVYLPLCTHVLSLTHSVRLDTLIKLNKKRRDIKKGIEVYWLLWCSDVKNMTSWQRKHTLTSPTQPTIQPIHENKGIWRQTQTYTQQRSDLWKIWWHNSGKDEKPLSLSSILCHIV